MSESAGERSFEATPTRLRKSRERGEGPRSNDLSALAAFGAAFLALLAVVPPLSGALAAALRAALAGNESLAPFVQIASLALLPMAAAATGAAAIGIAQGGGLRVVALKLAWNRLAPHENLKRILSRETAIALLRVPFAGIVAAIAVAPSFLALLGSALREAAPSQVAAQAWHAVVAAVGAALAVASLFALLDYASAHRGWLKKLRMSAFEMKREVKESDGDPQVRGRRRSLHRALLRSGVSRIRDASFVIANPTHVAVALEYRPPEIAVPRLLARGSDASALELRRLAAEAEIPVLENPPLARAIFARARIGEEIPGEFYVAVAEIVVALVRAGALAQ